MKTPYQRFIGKVHVYYDCELYIDALYTIMTEDIIKAYHKNNLKVNVYTVNDLETAEKLISWGIDYITSNVIE